MSLTEIILALTGLLGVSIPAYLVYRRGSRNDEAAQDNAAHADVYAGYGGLLQRYQEDNVELRNRITEMERQQTLK